MGGQTISTSETKIESIRLQSSTYGATLPLVYGVTRVPGNMLWYGGFEAIPHTTKQRAGKGGGTTIKNTTYTYTANVAMGLCEGPIAGIPRIWRGKTIELGGLAGVNILKGSDSYTVPGGGGSKTVTNSSTWSGTIAVYYTGTMDQGDGTTSGPVFLAEGTDFTVLAGVYAFGSAWSGKALTIEYQYTSGGTESALATMGLTKFSGRVGQATWSVLSGQFPSEAIPYSGMAYVAGADYDLGSDATVPNHNFELQARMAYHLGSTIPDVDAALIAVDALTNGRYGASFPASRINFGLWSRYCRAAGLLLSPAITEQVTAAEVLVKLGQLTNTAPVWSADTLKMIPYGDEALTGNGATYTPNVTPVYDLDDAVLLAASGGGEPIEMSLKPRADAWNHVRIEYLDRSAAYNVAVAEAKDQADIDAFGIRSSDVIQAHWINDATIARQVTQLLLQRALFVRASYKFRLPWTFALLEPMDLVTLTDSALGLDQAAVRITSIEEAEDGELTIEAEEYPAGVAAAALYESPSGAGYQANYNADPGDVSTPVIFEAPAELSTTGLEVYAAVTGVGADWGGCNVWVSLDGVGYYNAGAVYGGARYGSLTGAVSGGNLPVSILTGQLVAASAADAAAHTSLCYIGGATPEYLSHQGATLTGPGAYTLSGLVRAAYGTESVAHTAGDTFVRVDSAIGKSGPLAVNMIGKTIYFKFTSFNIYGGAEQALEDVSAYSYTITGYMAERGPAILYYIKPTNGTAIKNGTGTLTLEVHRLSDAGDETVTTGTVQLYVGTTLVTFANGYASGSDGYTGVFDSGDITGDVVVLLKDGSSGTVFDSITLVDVLDGESASAGLDAVHGYITPSAPLGWVRSTDQVTWTPSATTVDLEATFVQGGAVVGRITWRVTRTSAGLLSGAQFVAGNEVNTARISVTELNENSQAFTINFAYSDGTSSASIAETVLTQLSGTNGTNGTNGTAGYNTATLLAYKRSASTPADNPGAVTYTFSTAGWTPANGWSKTVPAGTDPVWLVAATAYANTSTDAIAAGEWSSPVQVFADGATGATGAAGISVAELSIYKRATAAPTTPTGGSYDFTGQSLTPPSGWSSAVPSGSDPCYVSRGVASIQGTTGSDPSITWSSPVLAFQDGASVDIVFTRSATQPTTPSASADVPSGWYSDVVSVPSSSNPLWSSVGTRTNSGGNWTWQTPIRVEGEAFTNLTPPSTLTIPYANPMGGWMRYTGASPATVVDTLNTIPGPFGEYAVVARFKGDGSTINWQGGLYHYFNVDKTKAYVSYFWVKRRSAAQSWLYLGWTNAGQVEDMAGVNNANPYFVNGVTTLAVDKWYLCVGILHPDGHTASDTGVAGVYDPDNGSKFVDGIEWQHGATATTQYVRIGNYNNLAALTSDDGFDVLPVGTFIMDGTHPTKEQILNTRPNGITGYLTNEAITLQADVSGTVSSYANATGTFKVFDGYVDVTTSGNVVFSEVSESSCTGTINASTGVYSVTAMSADNATYTVRATYKGLQIDKVFTLAKSRTGLTGDTGADGLNVSTAYIYQRTTTDAAPTLPSATVTYTFSTGGMTGLNNGWTATVPSFTGSNPYLWVSTATAASANTTDTISSGEWAAAQKLAQNGADGADGADGLSVAELQIFIRASSAPATPTGGSYSFDTKTLAPPASWSSSIPAGTNPVYASRAVAAITGISGTDSTLTWSAPVLAFQNGADGDPGADGQAVDIIFKRSATQPATPAASSGTPATWYSDVSSVPASSNPLWSSIGTRPDSVSNYTWQTPVQIEGVDVTKIIPDPHIEYSGSWGDYWAYHETTAGDATDLSLAISASGGVAGGKVAATFSNSAAAIYIVPVRSSPLQMATGEYVSVVLRWRRTSTVTGGTAIRIGPRIGLVTSIDSSYWGSIAIGNEARVESGPVDSASSYWPQIEGAALNAVTVNQWQETRWLLKIVNYPKSSAQAPYLLASLMVSCDAGTNGGTIEVDAFDVSRASGADATLVI